MRRKTCFTRTLSVMLSILMACSCFGILRFEVLAAGSATEAHWTALVEALRNEDLRSANYNGTSTVTIVDKTGAVITAAKAYYAVLSDYILVQTSGGKQSNDNEYKMKYRTSSQVRDIIKTELQTRMGNEYTAYDVARVITYLGGNVTVSGDSSETQNSVPNTTVTVTVTNYGSLMSYATLADVQNAETYSYSITHRRDRYYVTQTTSGSGCNATTTDHNNYYCVCSGVSSGENSAAVDISALTAFQTVLNDNVTLLNKDQAGKIACGYDALSTAYNAINDAKTGAVNTFSAAIVEHFFKTGSVDYYAKIDALEAAMKIAQYQDIVDEINGYVATDISGFTLAQLDVIYTNIQSKYNSYVGIGIDEVYAYFETENHILDRAAVEAKYAEIQDAYERAYLTENVKPQIEADFRTFGSYDYDWLVATDNADVPIAAALTAIAGYINTLQNDYKASNVAAVFGENYYTETVYPLRAQLNALETANEYKEEFIPYKNVYSSTFAPVDAGYSTDQLYSVLSSHDSWYTQLQAYVARVNAYDEVLAQKIFTDLEAAMEAKIDTVYMMLNDRVEADVNTAYGLYQGFVAEYGYTINTSDDITVSNYNALRQVFNNINPAHYEFLEGTDNFDIDPATVEKYEEIRDAVFAFVNYDASKGLSAYKYNKEYIADIIRMVSLKDVARNADYDVTDEKVEAIIDILENLLASDTVKEKFDLSGTVSGILNNLYTDDFLNTLIQYVYPMVAFEFAKVWAGLPHELKGVETGNSMAPTANITLNLNDLPTALNKLGLNLLPSLLAKGVSSTQYPAVYGKLNAVPTTTTAVQTDGEWSWGVNPWENPNIYDAETGKLTLEWGITDKESFLQAASQALSGVAPLLLAVLSNASTTKQANIGTGTGNSPDCSLVSITVNEINLTMTFGGNPGYNNMLAPILAVLGADELPNGNSLNTIRKVLENGVIGPAEQILNKLADRPLDTILRLLPSLAFALNLNLVEPLMNELKTSIAYKADAEYTYKASIFASGSGTSENAMADSLDINLGEMINLADMGIDITSMNGLVSSLVTMLTKSDEEAEEGEETAEPVTLTLPEINEARLSMLGTDVEWISGYRTASPFEGVDGHGSDYVRIVVDNRADVFLDVLDYLAGGIANNDLVNNIIAVLNSKKTEEEAQIELSEMIQGLIGSIAENKDDAFAALTELIFPQRYEMPAGIEWITEGNISESDYADFWTPDYTEYTGTDWTREDALFVAGHLEDILTYVVRLLGDTAGNAQTLGEAVQYFAGTLFTANNVNTIAGALGGLLGGLELPEAIAEMGLFEQLGLDPTAWDDMTFEFEDGDVDAFKNALITVLQPLTPLLAFLLAEQDIELTLLDAVTVKALGYDGYSYGLVPLLEALRCTGVKTTAEFIADKENIVANIVNPLFTAIDALMDDPLAFVGEIVPSAIYFDMVDGIRVAFEHLLFGVDVLLDTIRPIYDIDIRQMLGSNLDFDLGVLASDPLKFIMTKVSELLSDKAGIDLTIDYSIDTLKGTLHFTDPERFDSANGDDAYTIHLSEDGKAELMVRVLDYVMAQIGTADNPGTLFPLVTDLIDSETMSGVVGEILNNVITNYPDSIVALVKLLFPERQDIEPLKIQWITENIGAREYAQYWYSDSAPETEWTKAKAEYVDSHLEDVLNYAVALFSDKLGGAKTLNEAAEYLVGSLMTAENANALAAKINELVSGFNLADAFVDIFASFGIDVNAWSDMSFTFADGDVAAFKNALITILDPIAPALRLLLTEVDITGSVLDVIPLTLMGYDGYSWGLVPLLEALGCTGVKSTAAFADDSDNIVKNIVDPLFTLVDQLTEDPLAVVKRLIPALIYFDQVDGFQICVQNLLTTVNVVLDTIRPIYDIDVLGLIAENTGLDLADTETSILQSVLDMIPGLLGDSLGGLTLNMPVLDELRAKVHFTDPEAFDSANGEDGYTNGLTEEGELEFMTAVLDYAVKDVVFEENNRAVINGMIEDAMGEGSSSGPLGEILTNFNAIYPESVLVVLRVLFPERVPFTAPKINWITSGNLGAQDDVNTEIPDGEHTLWTSDKAVYMANHLSDFLNDVVVIFGDQLGGAEDLSDAVNFLANDLMTAENANKIVDALKNLTTNLGLSESIIDIIAAFDVDLHAWDNMSFSFADGDKAAFKSALITTLKPLAPVLRFILIEGGDLKGDVLDAIPITLMGYDGYSYGLVPLMEALGCKGIKTTAQFKADKEHVVENIVNPLFTAIDHLIADPLGFIEEVIPALVYFDKVEGVQVAVENLLFSVNVVLDTIRPLYDVDIYELVEEKTGIDLHFEDTDPIEVLLQKLVELVEDRTGVDLEIDVSIDNLCESLHFTDPQKFTSANGDDAYTIRLTAEGRADLISHTLDYAVNQVAFGYNYESLLQIVGQLITDPDTRSLVIGIISIMKEADEDIADYHGVHDVALASLFWVFFGADAVTDAASDFLYRYKDGNWYEIIFSVTEKAPDYIQRAAFLLTEAYNVEYPAFEKIIEDRKALLKPPYEYNEEETQMAAGIGARIIRFFIIIVTFFKKMFKK